MSDTQDDRYLRYCIARLSAYRNVWWSLANEFDFLTDRPAGHRGNKQMKDWDRFCRILHNEDAHARLRGIHNGRIWSPLSVTFRSHTDVSVAWDFGDGAVSSENPVTHVFEQLGLYRVTLRATGPDEGSAVDLVQIAVDRDNDEPIVRVGYSDGESASVTFHGTARVGQDGSFVLPDGQPWGRVQVGEGVQEDLRGLRSFTIMGWVKPDSLDIGSGGNRILFCLNKDRAGIDLVCHPDGRLRMSVNQWPDSVQNDRSPGKLITTDRNFRTETDTLISTIVDVSVRWILNKNVVETNWRSKRNDEVQQSGKTFYGWNPAERQIFAGGMDSEGSSSLGTQIYDDTEKQWTVTMNGVEGDGTVSSATVIHKLPDKDTVLWQAKDRQGGPLTGDSPVYEYRRVK